MKHILNSIDSVKNNFRDMQIWTHLNSVLLIYTFKFISKYACNTIHVTFHANFHSGKFHCDRSKGKK